MFAYSAPFYDAIYSFKDYAGEAGQVHALIGQHCRSDGRALLDVACGAAKHLYLVGTPQTIDYFSERHELGLFTHQQYLHAFQAAALETSFEPEGLTGRGLYIGRQAGEND